MNRPPHPVPDLDALLAGVPPEEAARLRAVWDLAGGDDPTPSPDAPAVAHALARWHEATDGTPAPAPRTPPPARPAVPRPSARPSSRRGRRLGRSLSLGLVVVLVGVLAVRWWQQPVVQTAAPGDRLTLTLPDGSQVELNSGSSLRYARHFGAVRRVELDGEAFFDVVASARPFVVQTFNAEVRVLGTRFGVRAWAGRFERATTVALASGRVTLAPAGQPARAVAMAPGEIHRVASRDAEGRPRTAPSLTVDEATAWRQGDLVFKDQHLGVILSDVERRFAVALEVTPSSLVQRRLNLALRRPASAEAVVRDLAAALGLRYRPTAAGYELYAPTPP